jgi:uncharacterized protein involved in exopolysaccharide biosynthesis
VTETNLNSTAEKDLGYGQLFAVLLRRRLWLLTIFCGVLSTALIFTLLEKPTYKSSMQLLVESNYQSKGSGQQTPENQFTDSNVEVDNATQISLMRSSHLLERAVVLLRPDYPNIKDSEIKSSLALNQVVAEGVKDKIDTKIFQAVYTNDDPVKTQKVLKAIQKVYQDYNREQQKLRLSKGLAFVNEQLPQAQNKVNQAEADLKRFRKRHKLIDPELQAKALTEALNGIMQQQRTNQIQLQQAQARYIALQQQINRSPKEAIISSRLSQSSRYQMLLNEIQKTDLTLVQQRLRFTDTSPTIQTLLEQRQKQQDLLQEEMGQVLGEAPNQQSVDKKGLLTESQLGELDVDIAGQLVEAQANLLSLRASAQSLVQAEQQLRSEIQFFPSLLAEYNRLQPEVEVNRTTLERLLTARQN